MIGEMSTTARTQDDELASAATADGARTSPHHPAESAVAGVAEGGTADQHHSTPRHGAEPARPDEQQQQQHGEKDEPVTMLKAAFPAMDSAVIAEVLAGHGGNPDAASIALLEMSDASAGVSTNEQDTASLARSAQLASDEAYARELMAQMEREHQQAYGRPLGSPPQEDAHPPQHGNEIDYSALSYVPRQRNRFGQSVGQQDANGRPTTLSMPGYNSTSENRGTGRDELDQLAEQFGKFADTGKKTLNSLMSRAKDKYVQVQQQRAQAVSEQDNYQGDSDSRGTSTGPTTIAGFTLPSIPAPWQSSNPLRRPMSPREAVRAESPSTRESAMKDYSQSPSQPFRRTDKPLPGLGTQPVNMGKGSTAGPAGPYATSPTPGTATSATAAFSSSPSSLPRSGMAGSPAKVQMLPRQTISLLGNSNRDGNTLQQHSTSPGAGASAVSRGNSTGAGRAAVDSDDDDDDVEYVRNPFNDDD